ncbi:bacteriohemerythrin [Candidatus Albibeggiatoa sp. nov. NOAA]|uniref:bacteriohemerythrin n=1 Tax=Candidatus Albibeggiatoa sp. nov. NOAA TaxID=3162724 RepID=UPI0032FD9CDE|nr:bacteriohemerythrin [Thiotrichaceae bacterium]
MKINNFVEWTDELSVGIQEIDEQHKILVDLLNRLYESIILRTDDEEASQVLTELSQYTIVHFAVEESLMRILGYDEYEEHKKHHEELTQQVIELSNKVKAGKLSSSMELLNFLKNWLTKHILIEDKRYTAHFLDCGVKKSWTEQSWVGRIWDAVHHQQHN